MRVAASTCREQQEIQRNIAENDPLENRRKVASAAAKAWGKEAVEADKREARELKRQVQIELENAMPVRSAVEMVADAG